MKKLLIVFLCALVATFFVQAQNGSLLQYPATKKVDQIDEYHGVLVADPYRWLEDESSAETKAWVAAQNKLTNEYLSKIPFRDAIRQRITEVVNFPRYSSPRKIGEYYFFRKNSGLQNQSVIYRQKGLTGKPEVFLDPNTFSKEGTTRVTLGKESKDKRFVGIIAQPSGADWQEITVMEVSTGRTLPDKIEWAHTSLTSWHGDGFYYTRYDAPQEGKQFTGIKEFRKTYFHRLGTPQSEDKLIYVHEHPHTLNWSFTTTDERFLIVDNLLGADKTGEIIYRDLSKPDAGFKRLFKGEVSEAFVLDNVGDKLLVLTRRNAPNFKLVLIDPERPDESNWQIVIAEKLELLEGVALVGGKIIAQYLKDVTSRLYQFDINGKMEREIKLPTLGSVFDLRGSKESSEMFFGFDSFINPETFFKYDTAKGKLDVFRRSEYKLSGDDYETKQVFYPSKDGTKIPAFITHKKKLKLDGTNPTLIYAYGGYAVNETPIFNATRLAMMDLGMVYVVANIRGGGEYGEEWHKAGMLLKTQNRFDDFIAAAEYLIREKYTSKDRLAIEGGSHGGNLVATVMLQRPDLFKVALPAVGTLDMMRFHKFTVGHNWKREYGDIDKPEDFKNLLGYSPVHNVKAGVEYPATLVTTAEHDDRVVPMHSYKFISELQAKQAGANPVLIRIETQTGHAGSSLTKRIEESTDIYSFMFYNMNFSVKTTAIKR